MKMLKRSEAFYNIFVSLKPGPPGKIISGEVQNPRWRGDHRNIHIIPLKGIYKNP
jgi:hypothetical protein